MKNTGEKIYKSEKKKKEKRRCKKDLNKKNHE